MRARTIRVEKNHQTKRVVSPSSSFFFVFFVFFFFAKKKASEKTSEKTRHHHTHFKVLTRLACFLMHAREKEKKKGGARGNRVFLLLCSRVCVACPLFLSFLSKMPLFGKKNESRVGEWEIFCTLAERSSLRSSAHLSSLRVRVHTVGPDLYTHKRASREVKEYVSSWGEQMCIVIIVFFCFLSTRALSGSTERSRFVPWCELCQHATKRFALQSADCSHLKKKKKKKKKTKTKKKKQKTF